jgi:protein-tyrosine phosphatase
MAESIFVHKIRERGLTDRFEADSAGTGDWHVGDAPDHRTVKVLADRGIPFASHARQVRDTDFAEFDWVIAMDNANVSDLRKWKNAQPNKILLMMSFDVSTLAKEVPDPYYGDVSDFEHVYSLLDSSTTALLSTLESRSHLRD